MDLAQEAGARCQPPSSGQGNWGVSEAEDILPVKGMEDRCCRERCRGSADPRPDAMSNSNAKKVHGRQKDGSVAKNELSRFGEE